MPYPMNIFTTREVDAVKPTQSEKRIHPRPSVLLALLALVAFVSACDPQEPSSPAEDSSGESGAELTTTSSPAYAGCYTDSATRALPIQLASTGATVETCIAAASAKSLAYAGVQYGGECFGGNTLGYTLAANSDCNMPCQASSGEVCGGSWRNSIYRTGSTANYKGCYTDDAKRALPTLLLPSGATVETCIAAAKAANLPYAGVQYGGECFGGNTLGYTLAANSDCNMPCQANSGEICGGTWRNSIYSTAVNVPAPTPTPTPTPTPAPAPAPAPAPSGPQLFVAPSGNDSNPGTEAQPWRTIQKAMNAASSGSTVNIRSGTYNERLTMNAQGTAGKYITFQPYGFSVPATGCGGATGLACGGEQVVLDYAYLGTNTSATPLLSISAKSYVRIQGITFQNFTCNGPMQQMVRIDGASSYVEFKYNRLLNSKTIGPWDGSTALSPIRSFSPSNNILIYGNEIANMVQSYGEAISAYGSTNGVIENNYIHDVDAIGIDVQAGASNYTVRGNRLEWISKKHDGTWWYAPAAAIYYSAASAGVIDRNYVANAGVGIQMLSEPGSASTHDVVAHDNVVVRSDHGIVIGTWYSNTDGSSVYNIKAYNNTFYGNSNGIVIRPMQSATVSWKNNIFAGNGTSYVNTLGWAPGTADYNLYSGGGSGPDAHPVTGDPKFTNSSASDFSLAAGSMAINTGDPSATATDVGSVDFLGNPRSVGGRVDIGAYEAR